MAKWGRSQIAVMALAAGWGTRSQDVSWVAMAESSGDDKVVNSIGCVGLLQINQPVHVKAHPTWTRAWLQNPQNNLMAGRILFKAAGNRFDGPWADSKTQGGIPGGWGPHVSATAGGGGTGAVQASDDPCKLVAPGQLRDLCKENHPDIYGGNCAGLTGQAYDICMQDGPGGSLGGGGLGGAVDTAQQLGRLAQAVARAGNWLSDPGNWVRIAYVAGGGLLALTAVNVIIQPYASRAYRQVAAALPVRTVRDVSRQRNTTTEKREP